MHFVGGMPVPLCTQWPLVSLGLLLRSAASAGNLCLLVAVCNCVGVGGGGAGRCLRGGGTGEGGLGEGGGGPGVSSRPPCQNTAYLQGTSKMYHTDPFSIYICHNA